MCDVQFEDWMYGKPSAEWIAEHYPRTDGMTLEEMDRQWKGKMVDWLSIGSCAYGCENGIYSIGVDTNIQCEMFEFFMFEVEEDGRYVRALSYIYSQDEWDERSKAEMIYGFSKHMKELAPGAEPPDWKRVMDSYDGSPDGEEESDRDMKTA